MSSLEILGCRLDPIDADEATTHILDLARGGSGAQVVTLGTEMVVYAQKDAKFRSIVNESALSLCDTVGVLTVARRRGAPLRDRVTGVELFEHLCSGAAIAELPVYFLGGGGRRRRRRGGDFGGALPGIADCRNARRLL